MKSLNIKEFKKVGGDEHHTILKSPKGHSITILHKPLAKAHVEALKALPVAKMAEGGSPADKYQHEKMEQSYRQESEDQQQRRMGDQYQAEKEEQSGGSKYAKMAKGGPVQKFADGGSSEPVADTPDNIAADAQAAPVRPEYQQFLAQEQAKSNPQLDAITGGAAGRATQDLQNLDKDAGDKAAYANQQDRILANVNAQRAAQGQPPLSTLATPTPGVPPQQAPGQQQQVPSQPTAPQPGSNPSDPYGANAMGASYEKGIGETKAGLYQEAAAKGQEGTQGAQALDASTQNQQKIFNDYQAHSAAINKEAQSVIEDYKNGHIDPNHFYNSMDTPKRITTAIGLLLSGLGSGPAHQSNAAGDYLDSQIARDIDAQKYDSERKRNVFSALTQQLGNEGDAAKMLMSINQGIVADQLRKAAATAASPLAKAEALQKAGALDMQAAQIRGQIAMNKSLQNNPGTGGDDATTQQIQMYRRMGKEDWAKDLQSRFVPGVGVASVPVPQETRDRIVGMQTFQQKAQHLLEFAQQNAGTVLNREKINEGRALAADLAGAYRQGTHGGVYKEGEQKFINGIVGEDPTAFFNATRFQAPLKATMQSMATDQAMLHKSVKLPPPAPTVSAPQYQTSGGVRYQKVNGGWNRVK